MSAKKSTAERFNARVIGISIAAALGGFLFGFDTAVINGAALEKIDDVANNAAVLVSARVTVTDMEGTNKPSQPYRLRIIVHEDDNGHMTAYDLKYPDGGN